ncbi:MAG: ribonuclease HII [Candidatus Parvarchaeota archaeon]|jgi:ribonuclease HII|nr:ribonuclease HII [Candidatus Parvarchaeota archaeon]MCL5106915.1 ribonuclease HII [Candidatus Parvarchaeota archaeon]
MITIGIDEAGRGPLIGPMTIAGIGIDEKTAQNFKLMGVKDSKMLSIKKIYLLEREITKASDNFMLIKLSAEEIDKRFDNGKNLNYLELDNMAEIANGLKGETVIVDSPSSNTEKIRRYLLKKIKDKKVIAENYADKNYIEVSAASVIAKAAREREVEKIKKELGYDFGSGYPSDPKTVQFIKIITENGKIFQEPYKNFIRKTWSTVKYTNYKTLNLFN